jgi:hypothetical protein
MVMEQVKKQASWLLVVVPTMQDALLRCGVQHVAV